MSGNDYFEVLGLRLEDTRRWPRARVRKEVEDAYKRLQRLSMQAGGRPRRDGRSQKEWRDLLKTARDVLSDEVRREEHIQELKARPPVRERMLNRRLDPEVGGEEGRGYRTRPTLEGGVVGIAAGGLYLVAALEGPNAGAELVAFGLGWLVTLVLLTATRGYWWRFAKFGLSVAVGGLTVGCLRIAMSSFELLSSSLTQAVAAALSVSAFAFCGAALGGLGLMRGTHQRLRFRPTPRHGAMVMLLLIVVPGVILTAGAGGVLSRGAFKTVAKGLGGAPVAGDPSSVEGPAAVPRPSFDSSTWRRIQRGLSAEGFYGGAMDGLVGPGTLGGIRKWQAARGMEVTGYLDEAQAEELIELAGPDAGPTPSAGESEGVGENTEEVERGAEGEAPVVPTGESGDPEVAPEVAGSLEAARDRFDAGDYEATVDAARALLQAQAHDGAAHLLLGQALYALGRFEASIEPLRRAIGLGERVELEARHRHGVGEFRQGFCRGALTFAGGDVMFSSEEDDSHDFHVAANRLTDVEVLESIDGQPFWLTSRVQDRGSQRRRVDFVHRNVSQQLRSGNSRYSAILGCSDCDGSLSVQAALMQAGG